MWKQDKNTSFAGESILDALRTHVDIQGDETAYTFLKSDDERLSITYRELDQSARNIAHGLLQKCNPGDRALLMYPAGLDFIQAFIGCLYAGVVAVPAYAPKKNRNAERILLIAKDCTPRLLLCDSETAQNVRGEIAESMENASVVVTNELDWKHEGPLPLLKSDQLAFLQYTSGSTADPKGVMVTHGNIIANEVLIERAFCHDSSAVVVGWLPMFHDMGLIGNILQPLFVGCHSILMSPTTFLRAPYLWLKAVTEYKATTTGAPNFAYDICVNKITSEQKQGLNLASLKIAYNGAEPVRSSTLEGFQRAFSKCGFSKDAWFPCYGLAETTLLVSGGPPLTNTKIVTVDATELERHRIIECDDGQQIVSCGQVGPGLDVRIVDPELFRECKSNEVGEIWTHGASVANGYWKRPQETHESFRAKLHGDNREWFRTGDYGFLRDGDLYITGRLKDLIIIRGRNIYPQDIERIVEQQLDFVEPNSCAAFSIENDGVEKLVIVAEGIRDMVRWAKSNTDTNGEIVALNKSIDNLRVIIQAEFDVPLSEIAFVRPTTFPRTSSGKVQRRVARQIYDSPADGIIHRVNGISFHGSNATCRETSTHHSSVDRADKAISWLREFSERRLNSLVADERRTLAPHVILELGNKGLLGLQALEVSGGLNLTTFDVMRVMEQLAAIDMSLASVVGVHNGLGLRPILNFGTDELKSEVVPSLASGRQLGSFALTEPASGSNPMAMQSIARPEGNGWKLTAQKQWIGLAQWAGTINVFARKFDAQGQSAGVIGITVPASHPQLRHGPESLTMGLRAIVQNDVFVDDGFFEPKYVLGVPGQGYDVAQDAMMFCRLGIAAEAIGIMKRCFQLMLRYASRRNISTGRLLDNPVTINRMEDILLGTCALESLVYGISKKLDTNEHVPVEAYAACKILGPELAWSAADRMVQCLGGRGYTETSIAPRIFRDTRLLRIFEGPTETLQMHLGSRVVQQFETIRTCLVGQAGESQIADRLKNDVTELMSISETTSAGRQWLFQQVGQIASWAIISFYAMAQLRPSSFSSLDVRKWAELQYDHVLQTAIKSASYCRVKTTTPKSLTNAGKLVEEGIGETRENLPAPSVIVDELLLPECRMQTDVSPLNQPTNQRSNVIQEGQPTDSSTRQTVRSIVLEWLQTEISPNASGVEDNRQFGSMGVDSVAAVSLTVALERAFGITLPDGLLFQHQSINELVAYLENETVFSDDFEIRLAVTLEEKEAVYQFRYSIYVEEMNRSQQYADHQARRIADPLDEHADLLVVWQGARVVGTVRMNPLRRDPLNEYRQIYGIEKLTEKELANTSISTRIMLAPHVRQSSVGGKLLIAAYHHGRKLGIKCDYCDCNDPVLSFFEQIGYRAIHRVAHPEYGDVSVMRLDLDDTEYLKSIGSPGAIRVVRPDSVRLIFKKRGFLLENVGSHTNSPGKEASWMSKITPEASFRQAQILKPPPQWLRSSLLSKNVPR